MQLGSILVRDRETVIVNARDGCAMRDFQLPPAALSDALMLIGADGSFDPARFQGKYGKLPSGYQDPGYRKSSLLRLFLYPEGRYLDRPVIIPSELRNAYWSSCRNRPS